MIRLADAETIDAVIGLFEAQLQEHGIKTSRDDLRFVVNTDFALPPGFNFDLIPEVDFTEFFSLHRSQI
jgi:hypothetical protein